jgi:hypothetical protein
MLDRALDAATGCLHRCHGFGHHRLGFGASPNAPTTEKVDAVVVRDTEQLRLERPTVFERIELSVCQEQRLLSDVLAVENGPDHS